MDPQNSIEILWLISVLAVGFFIGWIVYLIVKARITELALKESEAKQLKLNKQLAEKNKDLEQVVYITSHDLRSPLVNIQGFSRELENSLNEILEMYHNEGLSSNTVSQISSILESDIPEALRFIKAGVTKMDLLLSGLLRLSRLGTSEVRTTYLNMNSLVRSVVNAYEYQIQDKNVDLEIGNLPECKGDYDQINRLFSNLLENAIKFTHNKRSPKIKIYGETLDSKSVYYVQDNGIGIEHENREKIFEIFKQLKPYDSNGEGLGLTIVKKILERNNGEIDLESEPEIGSKFIVKLPAID